MTKITLGKSVGLVCGLGAMLIAGYAIGHMNGKEVGYRTGHKTGRDSGYNEAKKNMERRQLEEESKWDKIVSFRQINGLEVKIRLLPDLDRCGKEEILVKYKGGESYVIRLDGAKEVEGYKVPK